MKTGIHTSGNKGRGYIVRHASLGTVGWYERKADAVKAGRDLAKACASEHYVHRPDGRIQYRNSYGHDPRKSKG